MGLFPSNWIAEQNHGPVFTNLAGAHREIARTQATKELKDAGIYVHDATTPGEVNCEVIGACGSWIFRRCWYYWEACGPGIPSDIAKALHDGFGKEVRVEGHCGAPDPVEYCKGQPVRWYHVDTQCGLKALADVIKHEHATSTETPNAT